MPMEIAWAGLIQIKICDTKMYQVEFAGCEVTELTANIIAESIYVQCDANVNVHLLLDSWVDCHKKRKMTSLTKQQSSIWGRPVTRKTTADWEICFQWKDSSTSWEKLSKLKESHPMQTAEFAIVQRIEHKPAFNWWVKYVLKKRDRIIARIRKLQTRYLKKSHKFGIELPKTIEQALALDAKNGNTLWADVISKELENVRVAYEILSDQKSAPISYGI